MLSLGEAMDKELHARAVKLRSGHSHLLTQRFEKDGESLSGERQYATRGLIELCRGDAAGVADKVVFKCSGSLR